MSSPAIACAALAFLALVAVNLVGVVPPTGGGATAATATAQVLGNVPAATGPADPRPDPKLARGLELYASSCAACHGEQGLGDGSAAYLLSPKPRNFADGQFRITSTKSGLPSDADIMQVLRRGMPGSAMPSWGHMTEEDLQSLVLAVRDLAIKGKAAQLMANNKAMKPDRAMKTAHSLLDPGAVEPLPPAPAPHELDVKRGQTLYAANCAACHDADGRGRIKRDLKDNQGLPVFARDFTAGVFKGGSDAESLARRIVRGMPGSPMPAAADMPAGDLWSLVAYTQTFIKPGAQARVEQVYRTLVARRVSGALTIDPDAAIWDGVESTFIPLMPLWWRDDRIEGVNVAAIHNGKQLAIRLAWDDATANDLAAGTEYFTDGAALQLATADNPPLFAMGQKDVPVDIWHWKASRQRAMETQRSALDEQYPDAAYDECGAPDFQTAADVGNIVATTQNALPVESLVSAGFGTLSSRLLAQQTARGGARRTHTGWSIVFLHDMGAERGADAITLQPGGAVSIAFAAWDGAIGDRNGQKSVSIWHRLSIEK
jgi:mono/diheme cytochrome c family protein